jgi:hypothetical protein
MSQQFDVRTERSGGWSAFAFIVVAVVAGGATGATPAMDTPPGILAASIGDHRTSMLVGAWLQFFILAFWLWYVAGLGTYLTQRSGPDDSLPEYARLAGVSFGVIWTINAAISAAIAYPAPDGIAPIALKALVDVNTMISAISFMPAAVFAFAASHSMRRHRSAPLATIILGYLSAVLLGAVTLTLFGRDAFGPYGNASLIGLVPFFIWIASTGIVLVRNRAS